MAGRAAVPEVIWTRPERAGRGPKAAYSRGDIAAAAVRIADAEGLDAVSMRHVAAELGCGTMSLYNYVPRKEDLYELMVDAVSGEHDLWEPSGDWRADMLRVAHQTRALMHRHPWLPRLMSPAYGFSPNVLRYLEHCLTCLDSFDATYVTKFELIAMVNGLVTTYVGNELATAERVRSLPWSEEQENAMRIGYLGGQVASGAYPRMAAAFAEDAGPIDLEAVFERMLLRVLDGFSPRG
jgi:AcrR family transcriptional regulator